jgi:uncharacterized protein
MKAFLLACIRAYQRWVSPFTPGVCRFEPSCSRYATLCITHHGPMRGSVMTVARLCRCNPLFKGGLDFPNLPNDAPASDREPDWERLQALLDPSSSPHRSTAIVQKQ